MVWTPVGGPQGTLVVSDGVYSEVFLNREYGNPSAWEKVPSGHGVGYSRHLRVMPEEDIVLLINGGMYGMNYTEVTAGDIVVPGAGSNKDTISSCPRRGGW